MRAGEWMAYRVWLLSIVAVLILGCKRESAPVTPPTPPSMTLEQPPGLTALNRGARLFEAHCAQCHGPEAQGHPDWQNRDIIAAAPPLNGTGNDWKRSRAQLVAVIKNGATRQGTPVMPAWNGRLSEQEIDDIISWFQALWPPDVYATWRKTNPVPVPRG